MIRTALILVSITTLFLQSASAAVLSKADATHGITITGASGDPGDVALLDMEIFILTITEDSMGEGSTAAAASIFVSGGELFEGDALPIGPGASILATSSATAERSTPGTSFADSEVIADIVFSLGAGALADVTVDLTYFATASASVTGIGPDRFGFAYSDAIFDDESLTIDYFVSAFVDFGDGIDSDFDFGSESITLSPGDSVTLYFDLVQSAEAVVIPEPSMTFGYVAMVGLTSFRRRKRS